MRIKYACLVGVDIGGTNSGVCLSTDSLQILESRHFPTEVGLGFDHTFRNIVGNLREVLATNKLKDSDVGAIGISCGGPLDTGAGAIHSPPNLPGWVDIPIAEMLEDEFCIDCYLLNDADACALAEWQLGAGKGHKNLIFCTMGTGFGAGLVLNGRLYSGSNGQAGEVGHIRLTDGGPTGHNREGSLEGYCGGSGIVEYAKIRVATWLDKGNEVTFLRDGTGIEQITAQLIGDSAAGGDTYAAEILGGVGEMLGRGLSVLIDILNPEVIILGSIFNRQEHFLRPSMEKAIQEEALKLSREVCRIVPSALGEMIGDYAGLAAAKHGLETRPRRCHRIRPEVKTILDSLLARYSALRSCRAAIQTAHEMIRDTYVSDGKLLTCGNGGSAADAEHIVGELMKGFLKERHVKVPASDTPWHMGSGSQLQGALRAIALTSPYSLLSAFQNDVAYGMEFAQGVYGYGDKGDTLLAISTSGNSKNVVNAVTTARALGIRTIGLTGQSGGSLKEIADVSICVPAQGTAEVQELHLPVYHTLCAMLEEEFF